MVVLAWLGVMVAAGGFLASSQAHARNEVDHVAVEAVVAKFLDQGPTPEEMERAKSNIAASATFARDSQFAMASWYGGQLVIGQSVDRVQHWEDRIRAVTAEQVKAAMNAYMKSPHVDARLIRGGK